MSHHASGRRHSPRRQSLLAVGIGIVSGFACLVGLWIGLSEAVDEPLNVSLGAIEVRLSFDLAQGAHIAFTGVAP